jgi:hypothetical protein
VLKQRDQESLDYREKVSCEVVMLRDEPDGVPTLVNAHVRFSIVATPFPSGDSPLAPFEAQGLFFGLSALLLLELTLDPIHQRLHEHDLVILRKIVIVSLDKCLQEVKV